MRHATPVRPLPAWRRLAAAWALVALFGVALAPWISRGLQATRGGVPGELATLCSGSSSPNGNAPAGDVACALCVLAHAAPLVDAPPAPTLALPSFQAVFAHAAPVARVEADIPWRAQARAPPPIA